MTVYFIQSGESGPIKIGHTSGSPFARLSALQTGSPELLQLLGCCEGDSRHEADLHRRFANHRVRGEWFEPHKSIINIIGTKLPEPEVSNGDLEGEGKTLFYRIRTEFFRVSQGEFSKLLDVAQSLVSRWETGTRFPTGENLKTIRDEALIVDADQWDDSFLFEVPTHPLRQEISAQ